METVLIVLATVIIGYVLVYTAHRWAATAGSGIMTGFENDAVWAYGRVTAFLGSVQEIIAQNADILQGKNMNDLLHLVLTDKALGVTLALVGLGIDMAMHATASKLPNKPTS